MSSPLHHSPSASLSQPSPLGPLTPSPSCTTRLAAIATLRRAASQRESPSGPSHLSPSPSLERSSSLSLSPTPNPGASLERTASLLARSLAMAKLTGEKPPAPPASFGPLPTLGDLQARAAERSRGGRETMRRGLRRSNTVTGVGESWGQAAAAAQAVVRSPTLAPGEERAAARVNLMRKLSSRRLESPAPSDALAVGGRVGRARPRSGSVGATPMDWRRGIDLPVLPVMASEEETRTPLSPNERSETPFSTSARSSGAWERERNRASSRARRAGETAWEFEDRTGRDDEEVLSASADESWSEPSFSEQASPAAEMLESPPVSPLAPTSPERPLLPLRRGSIPTHLFPSSRLASLSSTEHRRIPSASFGIAAVEETDVRRRGSSASSGIIGGRFDSVATVALGRSGSLSFGAGEGSMGAGSSGSGEEDGEAQRLSEKVERKVAAGIARSGEGAFPPPQVGYTFPSPTTPRASEESVRSWGPGLAPEPDSPLGRKIGHEASTFIPGRYSPTTSRHSPTNSRQPVPSSPPPTRAPASPAVASTSPTQPTYQALSIPEALGGLPPLPTSAFATLSFPASFTTPLLGSVSSTSALQRTNSRDSLKKRWYPASMFKTGSTACPSSPHESVSTEMGRQSSAQSARTVTLRHSMEKGPSPSTSMEFQRARAVTPESPGSAPQSTYASSEEMKRGASGSSADSALFPIVSRQVRLPADQLPGAKILAHLDSILGTEELDTDAPSVLDHPPRRLLLHTPVLQVVNAQTVKDRHLFLFTDLLLIAKPIIEEHPSTGQPLPSTFESSFVVKSVVELRHLKLGTSDDADEAARSTTKPKRHPLLVAFIDRFANDPNRAIQTLIQKGGLANDAATIANLLFRNPELNRNQLGAYLAGPENRHILRAFIEKFKFGGVRIDDALRMFLMTIRVPYSLQVAEHVLSVVAQQWTEANGNTGYDPSLSFSLVLAIMQLSDALHAGLHSHSVEGLFSYPNRSVSVDDFVSSFRPQDPRFFVPEELLARIYSSVRRERIEQASDNSVFTMTPDIEATMEPAKLPGRLTYRTPSQSIAITIPAVDPKFSIKLHGTDLKFDPPHLSFAKSNTQSFRVTGSAIGIRTMVLIKMGSNAPQYQGLPLNKAFSIERAFMQHTFQISFINHLNVKRKYMFSTLDANIRAAWTQALQKRIASCLATPPPPTKSLAAAEAVAVQVLRDALIAPEELSSATSFAAPTLRTNTAAPRFGSVSATAALQSRRLGTPIRATVNGPVRSNSFSRTYAAGIGKVEADLKEERKAAAGQQRRGSRDEVVSPFAKRGKELTLLTEQNSLLPLVLSFLGAGADAAPNPLSTQGTAFQLRPLSPTEDGDSQVI